jgi:NAD(P)-dependent dehydrogenase (short-subunit alcohol dehydrogenase family)
MPMKQAARNPHQHLRTRGTGRTVADRAALVTGANRGIGRALVAEARSRGAKRVHAGTGQPLAHPDGRGRVTPLTLDVTNQAQIQAAAEKAAGRQRWIGGLG